MAQMGTIPIVTILSFKDTELSNSDIHDRTDIVTEIMQLFMMTLPNLKPTLSESCFADFLILNDLIVKLNGINQRIQFTGEYG